MNHDIHRAGWVTRWLAPRHPRLGQLPLLAANPKVRLSGMWTAPTKPNDLQWLRSGQNALLFCERPFLSTRKLAWLADRSPSSGQS